MFASIQSVIGEAIAENELTRRVAEALPARQFGHRPHPRARTAGELAWHLLTGRAWFLGEVLGFALSDALKLHLHKPGSKPGEITEALDALMEEELAALRAQDDTWLAEEIDFFGRTLTKSAAALRMLLHEAHHRGQLVTYLRAMGEKVPSVYGPSADDAATA